MCLEMNVVFVLVFWWPLCWAGEWWIGYLSAWSMKWTRVGLVCTDRLEARNEKCLALHVITQKLSLNVLNLSLCPFSLLPSRIILDNKHGSSKGCRRFELAGPDICTWILIILYQDQIRNTLCRMYILFEFCIFNIYISSLGKSARRGITYGNNIVG